MGAPIREELVLADSFSQTFRNFDAAAEAAINVAESFQKTLNEFSEGFLDGLVSSLNASRQRLEDMANAAAEAAGDQEKVTREVSKTDDEIKKAKDSEDKFKDSIKESEKAAGSLMGTLGKIAGVISVAKLAKNFVDTADEMSLITSKLNLINDGFMTTEQLQSAIYNSAQRTRSSYQDTAQLVARIGMNTGDTFKNNVEIVKFAENLNKSFKIAGASAQEQSSVILQLSQALAGGLLRGQEFNAVMSGAPNIIKNIADYMGVTVGEMRNLAAEGQITSDIIREAMLGATDDIDSQFNTLPSTFSDVMTTAKNQITNSLNGAFEEWITKLNGGDVQGAIDKVTDAVKKFADAGADALIKVVDAITWIIDNFEQIGPVLEGAGAAVLTYKVLHIKAAEEVATKWGIVNSVINKITFGVGLAVAAWSTLSNVIDQSKDVNTARKSGLLDSFDGITKFGIETGVYANSVGMMSGSTKGLYDILSGHGSSIVGNTRYSADGRSFSGGGGHYGGVTAAELAAREAERQASATEWYNSYYGSRYTPNDEGFAAVVQASRDRDALMAMYAQENLENWDERKRREQDTPQKVEVVNTVKLSDEDLKIFRDIAENRYIANVSLETLAPSVSVNVENNGQNMSEDDIASAVTKALETQISEHTAISHG